MTDFAPPNFFEFQSKLPNQYFWAGCGGSGCDCRGHALAVSGSPKRKQSKANKKRVWDLLSSLPIWFNSLGWVLLKLLAAGTNISLFWLSESFSVSLHPHIGHGPETLNLLLKTQHPQIPSMLQDSVTTQDSICLDYRCLGKEGPNQKRGRDRPTDGEKCPALRKETLLPNDRRLPGNILGGYR